MMKMLRRIALSISPQNNGLVYYVKTESEGLYHADVSRLRRSV